MKKTYIQPNTFVAIVNGNLATMQHASFSNHSDHYQGPTEDNDDEDFDVGSKSNNLWGCDWDY